ncbi:hypothetical protein ABIE67_006227 [Streptomyces sp. V4I8]|uniref:hypothetical protein n=1 Tax=Streptomyces sp. V4I8 TaxID=3156469 RepID=UPI0035125056
MSATSGAVRVLTWVAAVVCAAGAVALPLVAVLVDLDTADRTASVLGAIASLAGLLVAVVALARSGGGDHRVIRVRGRNAIGVHGAVVGNAFGANSKVSGPRTGTTPGPAGTSASEMSVRGENAFGAEGDVVGNAFGEGSEVDGR